MSASSTVRLRPSRLALNMHWSARSSRDTAVSLERADQCMFSAKRDGRNRTVDDSQSLPLSDVA